MRWAAKGLLACAVIAVVATGAGTAAQGQAPAQLDERNARLDIEQLVTEYSYLLDHGRAAELGALFTDEAVFDNPNAGVHLKGRTAIAAYYARRAQEPRTTRHMSTNLRIVFESPDRARGTRTILYFRGDATRPPFPAEPGSVGEYEEVYERGADERWRFALRRQQILFSGRP